MPLGPARHPLTRDPGPASEKLNSTPLPIQRRKTEPIRVPPVKAESPYPGRRALAVATRDQMVLAAGAGLAVPLAIIAFAISKLRGGTRYGLGKQQRYTPLARDSLDTSGACFRCTSRHRVVLEVDRKQHYANGDTASPALYSEMVSEGRRLRLDGGTQTNRVQRLRTEFPE